MPPPSAIDPPAVRVRDPALAPPLLRSIVPVRLIGPPLLTIDTVPESMAMVPAKSIVPGSAMLKVPFLPSAILPVAPMVFSVPRMAKPAVLVPVLCNVPATIVPVVLLGWLTLPPFANRSTVLALRKWPLANDTPPLPPPIFTNPVEASPVTVPLTVTALVAPVPRMTALAADVTRPATATSPPLLRDNEPLPTEKAPMVGKVLVPVSVAPPAIVPILVSVVPATIEPDSVMPPALAPRATAEPAFRKPPIPTVPALREMFCAATVPGTDRLPVLASVKSPVETVKPCRALIAFAVPAKLTVPKTPLPLWSVPAIIVPAATCVTPPPPADRSTVVPDKICPAFSAMPPAPADSVSPVLAPMLPVTAIVAALVREIGPVAAVSGPATVNRPASPPLPSTNPLAPDTAKLPMVSILAPHNAREAAPPLSVPVVTILPPSAIAPLA